MNILATYASSYVNAFDVALSARSEQKTAANRNEAAPLGALRKLFSLGLRADAAKAA
ncbi:hypothetical protein [Parvibaculum sp.]|uniref:hypothetical protein n=1 Tax=Parvibaculum sp. TaxID=2024848 RepID=UPI002723E9CA|nr:hypothetical protein [Parvibaculum sp.]MDO9125504.1 hypothetical protein [Parvibaculum sp.]MDP1625962.1 hypothetical protein [Parvibaculum sp.]MDP2149667.1 hypothetical protein [Parvibaculum sp.]MDP3329591.1 hypothetical protein [Parvibaculum sp.]